MRDSWNAGAEEVSASKSTPASRASSRVRPAEVAGAGRGSDRGRLGCCKQLLVDALSLTEAESTGAGRRFLLTRASRGASSQGSLREAFRARRGGGAGKSAASSRPLRPQPRASAAATTTSSAAATDPNPNPSEPARYTRLRRWRVHHSSACLASSSVSRLHSLLAATEGALRARRAGGRLRRGSPGPDESEAGPSGGSSSSSSGSAASALTQPKSCSPKNSTSRCPSGQKPAGSSSASTDWASSCGEEDDWASFLVRGLNRASCLRMPSGILRTLASTSSFGIGSSPEDGTATTIPGYQLARGRLASLEADCDGLAHTKRSPGLAQMQL
mmetsp:Transcript_32354/g.46669  ORF Transcript_32354/g.46669 Transcript_32354/m.46669 type:complete len:330 (+) Transcript_32354:424-1413(+)